MGAENLLLTGLSSYILARELALAETPYPYLERGTPKRQRAHRSISPRRVLEELKSYRATFVSSACLDIDIEGSNLEIICELHNQENFSETISTL